MALRGKGPGIVAVIVGVVTGYYQYDSLMLEHEKDKILKKQQSLPPNMIEIPVEYTDKIDAVKETQK